MSSSKGQTGHMTFLYQLRISCLFRGLVYNIKSQQARMGCLAADTADFLLKNACCLTVSGFSIF